MLPVRLNVKPAERRVREDDPVARREVRDRVAVEARSRVLERVVAAAAGEPVDTCPTR